MSIRKSTIRLILVLYFILLFSFVAYLGNWGYWKQDKYSETAYMEELEASLTFHRYSLFHIEAGMNGLDSIMQKVVKREVWEKGYIFFWMITSLNAYGQILTGTSHYFIGLAMLCLQIFQPTQTIL